MNRVRSFAVLFCATTLLSTLFAEEPIRAKVPFSFHVANRVLPAGEYRIEHDGAFLHIEKSDDHRGENLVAAPDFPSKNGSSFLEFDQVDGMFFLRRIVTPRSARRLGPAPSRIGTTKNAAAIPIGLGR